MHLCPYETRDWAHRNRQARAGLLPRPAVRPYAASATRRRRSADVRRAAAAWREAQPRQRTKIDSRSVAQVLKEQPGSRLLRGIRLRHPSQLSRVTRERKRLEGRGYLALPTFCPLEISNRPPAAAHTF